MEDLGLIDAGTLYDVIIENGNDAGEYDQVATQEDYDSF